MSARDNGGFDDEPISFGEAFGINPDGSPYEAETPAADPTPAPDEPSPELSDASGEGSDAESPPTQEPQAEPTEWEKRGLKTVDDVWKSYRELETRFSQRQTEQQATPATPQQETRPPVPLFKGEVSDIKTEADLYNWAAADPEAAAMFAMQNHERLNEEQLNNVMDNWIARQPWKAQTTIRAWDRQMYQEDMAQRQALQDSAYMDTIRETGIERAIQELPMLDDHRQELGAYIEAHPQLATLVDGAKTADELKSALLGSFYMMAGPKLAEQALEAQVAKQVQAKQLADQQAEQAKRSNGAQTLTRNTATPPSNDSDDAIRALILNSKRK